MRPHIAIPPIALALTAAPLAAQSSVRDFTLPEPTPTATPRVQGPADDSGVVPVGPRVIPTDRPTPQPTASPSPTATTSPAARPTAAPIIRPLPTLDTGPAAQPGPRATNQPAQPVETDAAPATPSPLDSEPVPPQAPATVAPQGADSAAIETDTSEGWFPIWLQWVLGGLGLLVGLFAIGAAINRRKAQALPPEIEPPLAPGHNGTATVSAMADEVRFDTRIEVESLSRSFRMVTAKCRIEISNRGDRAVRDLSFGADLISAARGSDESNQLANASLDLPAAGTIDRIGPHQSRSIAAQVKMPIETVRAFTQGQVPMFVPLLRLRIDAPGITTRAHTYALGLGGASANRVNPLPLNDPLGTYQGARAVRVDPA